MSCDFPWSVVFEVVSVIAFASLGNLSGCSICVLRKGLMLGEVGASVGRGGKGVNSFLN